MELSLFVAGVLVLAGLLAFEFGVSTAITEIVAGVILGLVLDVESLGWAEFLAQFGMLGLMFMAGFEVDPAVARRTWRMSLSLGLAAFVVPYAGVLGVCRWLFDLPSLTSSLVATGLSTTSLALVYQFLRERGALPGDLGQAILAAAMVVDVISMIVLATLLGDVGWATAIFVLAAAPGLLGLPRVGQWIFARYRGNAVEFELRFLLLVLVGLGFIAHHAGIHAAVIGFITGLVLSGVVQDHEVLEEKVRGLVFGFFGPVFFLRAGTQIDLRGLDGRTILLFLALLVVAVGLKYVGAAGLLALRSRALGHAVGVLFNYRLTFGIISATVGFESGLVDRPLFTAMLLVVLSSAALPVILLRRLGHVLAPASPGPEGPAAGTAG